MKLGLFLTACLLLAANAAMADDPTSFDALLAKAQKASQAPEAEAWEQNNLALGQAKLTSVMTSCRSSAPNGQKRDFVLLVQLAKDGQAQNVLVSPSTPYSECARRGLAGTTFGSAPWAGYWLVIKMEQ